MKKSLFSLFALLLVSQLCAAKIIENPHYEFRSSVIPKITKIELTDTETILHIRYTFKPNWWIMIGDNSCIKNSNGDEAYTIKSLEGGELNAKLKTPKCGYQDLVLHFDAIDKSITEIDFGGDDEDWKICNIDLTGEKSDKWDSILPKELHGNWSDNAGVEGWCYGFYEDCALIGSRFWEYAKVERHKGGYRLNLTCDGKSKILYVKVDGENLAIGTAANPTSLYTTDKPIYNTRGLSTSDIEPFKTGSMVLNGYIEGYSPRSGLKTGLVYSDNSILRDSKQALVTVEEDGRFSATVELGHANRSFIRFDNFHINLYVTPSDTLTLYLSYEGMMQQRMQGSHYVPADLRAMGANARLNVEMGDLESYINLTMPQSNELRNLQKSADAEKYRDKVLSMYRTDSVKLEQQLSKSNFMPASKKIARTSLVAEFTNALIEYTFGKDRTLSKQKKLSSGVVCNYQDYGLPEDYFDDMLRRVDVGDHTSMMLCHFSVFVNRYEFAPFFGHYSSSFNVLSGMGRLVDIGVINVDEETRKLFDTQNKNIKAFKEGRKEDLINLDSLSGVKLMTVIKEHIPMVRSLFADSLVYIPARAKMEGRIAKGRELWGKDGDLLSQIVIARGYKSYVSKLEEEQERQYLDMVLEYVTDPNISEQLTTQFDKKYAKSSAASTPIPDGVGKEIVERLLKPHKGKYVMIDFWSAGCGPCIYGIKKSHDLRKRLSNEPIVFMFVTDKRSTSQSAYDKYMNPTVGDKHHITVDEWDKVASLFNINTIPRYILFDKDGQVIDDHFTGGWNAIESKLNELER